MSRKRKAPVCIIDDVEKFEADKTTFVPIGECARLVVKKLEPKHGK